MGSEMCIRDRYDIKEKGLKGIKLHPEYQQFYIDSKESIQILKKCEELDLITVLHSGKDIGIDPPVHCTPERLSHVLDYVKGDKIVAAHSVSYTHLRAHETDSYLVCRLLLEKKKKNKKKIKKKKRLKKKKKRKCRTR